MAKAKTKTINVNKSKPINPENKSKLKINIKKIIAKLKIKDIKELAIKYNIMTYTLIAVVLFVFSLIISAQLNTVGNTNVISKGMREADLLAELSQTKILYDDLKEDYEKSQEIVDEYKTNQSSRDVLVASMKEELDKANILAGLVDVKGEGILITINDSTNSSQDLAVEAGLVHDTDLSSIINELRSAGVEAMNINGQRIIVTTAIRCVGPTIQVNSVKIAAPFYIKAIGNSSYLESALKIKGGIVDSLRSYGIQIKIEKQEDILIEKYDAAQKIRVAKPVK